MKPVKALTLLAAMVVLTVSASRIALAQEPELISEPALFHSHVYFDFGTGAMYVPKGGATTELAGDVYNNTNPAAPANFGLSSTDLFAQWGDRLNTTGPGTLQENDFTIYNSPSSAGALEAATFRIDLFEGGTFQGLGGYTTGSVNFGAGLPPGFFSIVTITGLGGLNININTTDVVMLQQVDPTSGGATRLGIASLDPPTIGSSANTMWISAATINGGANGFYNVGNPPLNANPGYRVNVNQPVPTQTQSWGSLKALYH